MLSTPWKKAWRDLWTRKTRTFLVLGAIAASVLTLGTTLVAHRLLDRNMNAGFLRANPHNLLIRLEKGLALTDLSLLEGLRALPEVETVEARFAGFGRIQNARGQWRPLQMFAMADFSGVAIDIMTPDSGAWPPEQGNISIERQALSVLDGSVGETVRLELNGEVTQPLEIGGIVHDVVLPQAEWENVVYAYAGFDTLLRLGIEPRLNQIYFRLTGAPSRDEALRFAESLKPLFAAGGHSLDWVQAANPGQHPHHAITAQMFLILKIFGWFCCLFSSILVVNLMTASLAAETRQIGVMKAIGGKPRQIGSIYAASVLCLGTIALGLALPFIFPAGLAMAEYFAAMMNFDIGNRRIPSWIFTVLFGIAAVLPLLLCYWPIRRASGKPIRESLVDYGIGNRPFRPGLLDRLVAPWLSPAFLVSFRNSYRKRGRFLLNAGVLAVATAFMIGSVNLDATMTAFVEGVTRTDRWDLRVKLESPVAAERLRALSALPEIDKASPFFMTAAHIPGGPEKPNREFSLIGIDVHSPLLVPSLLRGAGLTESGDEILLGQALLEALPGIDVGETVELATAWGPFRFRVTGIAASLGHARAYVSQAFFLARGIDRTDRFFLGIAGPRNQAEAAVTQFFEEQGIGVSGMNTPDESIRAVVDHFEIIFRLSVLLTVFLGTIGINGLVTSMAIDLLERTRELGIFRAIGASRGLLLRIIVAEGIVLGMAGWAVGALAATPLSQLIATQMGRILLGTAMPLAVSVEGMVGSLVLVPLLCALACMFPAIKCANRPVRDNLAYE